MGTAFPAACSTATQLSTTWAPPGRAASPRAELLALGKQAAPSLATPVAQHLQTGRGGSGLHASECGQVGAGRDFGSLSARPQGCRLERRLRKPHPETNPVDTYLTSHSAASRDTRHHISPSACVYVHTHTATTFSPEIPRTVSAAAGFVQRVFLFRFSLSY